MRYRLLVTLGLLLLASAPHAHTQESSQDSLSREPVYTPFTQRPELSDRREALMSVQRHHPKDLREAGVGGKVALWVFIDVDGRVKNTVVHESSGYRALDQAAEAASREFSFAPARLHQRVVPAWVNIPITFEAKLSVPDDAAVAHATVSDIDGNVYPTVRIGEQHWMATNLQVTRDPAGGQIASFFFNDDSLRYAGQGRLYTWDVVMNGSMEPGAQGLCPDGWHLPRDEDWTQLFDYLKGLGAELMAGGSTGFEASLDGGADYRGNYVYRGDFALFWSSTEVSEERSYHHSVSADGELDKFAAMKGARIYVRCVED